MAHHEVVSGKERTVDCRANTGTDVLSSIVATLLSLAALAECLGDMPAHVRRRVLAVLLHGEIVAYASFFDIARHYGAPVLPQAASFAPPPDGDAPTDAAGLALRLRALALVWSGLVAWIQSTERRQARDDLNSPSSVPLRKVDVADMHPVRALARSPPVRADIAPSSSVVPRPPQSANAGPRSSVWSSFRDRVTLRDRHPGGRKASRDPFFCATGLFARPHARQDFSPQSIPAGLPAAG